MGAYNFILNKFPLFARKPINSNVSVSAAPSLGLVPASRYNCCVKKSYVNVCSYGGP